MAAPGPRAMRWLKKNQAYAAAAGALHLRIQPLQF